MDKKTKTSSQSTSDTNMSGTATSTPNAPSWVTGLSENFAGQIPGMKTPVAGASGLQQGAFDAIGGQSFGGMFGDAAAGLKANMAPTDGGGIQAKSGLGGVQDWLNPFLGGVVDATTADLNANDAQTRARQTLQMAGAGAFGGSGSAITQALTEGELERARATTLGGLRMGAFDSAAGNSQQDANRDLQAQIAAASNQQAGRALNSQNSQALAGIGQTGIRLQADLGDTQRGITQAQNNGPLADLMAQLGLFGQLPSDLLTGHTNSTTGTTSSKDTGSGTSTTHDPLGQLTALLAALPGAPPVPAG